MPERVATQNPHVMVGSTISGSLGPNTGQICMTFGGQRSFQKQSGTAGGAATIWTGAGRLDSILFHAPTNTLAAGAAVESGLPLVLFDSVAHGSGAPLSGEIVLWRGVSTQLAYNSVISGVLTRVGGVLRLGHPFLSGLSHSSISGQDGFTVFFTPVVSGSTSPG